MVLTKKQARKRANKAGNGKVSKQEITRIGRLLRDAGSLGGGAIGSYFGAPGVGASAGRLFGAGISKIFGQGAYNMQQNSMWSAAKQCPSMHSSNESVVFRHREYIRDISATSLFTVTEDDINPGLDGSFPYLSAMAQNFQEYRFKGLVYEFRSTSATSLVSGTNTAMGAVIMAAQYRADANAFQDKQQMLNEMWSVDCKPSENMYFPIECSPDESPLKFHYIRTGALAPNQDQKFYDLCKLSVATVGSQSTNIIGELWATYEVEFKKPTLYSSLGFAIESANYIRTPLSGLTPLGSAVVSSFDQIGLSITSTAITFPLGTNGRFYLTFLWFGAAAVTVQPVVTLTNAIFVAQGGNNQQASTVGAGRTDLSNGFLINIQDPNLQAVVTFGTAGTIPAATCTLNLNVTQYAGIA